MTGLLRLEQVKNLQFENQNPNDVFMHFENIFAESQKVLKDFDTLDLKSNNSIDLALMEFRLERFKGFPLTSVRMENHHTPAQRLELRMESFFSSLWKKIVAFWDWVVNSISKLFGGKGKEASSEEIKEAEKKVIILEKLQPETKFAGLDKLRKFLGSSSFKSVKNNIKEIVSGYFYISKAASMLSEDFETFVKDPAIEALKIARAGKEVLNYVGANSSYMFSKGSNRVYFLGGGKGLLVEIQEADETKNSLEHFKFKPTEINADDYFNTEVELKLLSSEFKELLKVLRLSIEDLDKESDFFLNVFKKDAEKISEQLNKISSSETTSRIDKNKLSIFSTMNTMAMELLSAGKHFHQSNISLKAIELNIIEKINGLPTTDPKDSSENIVKTVEDKTKAIMKRMDDPNDNGVIKI